MQLAADGEGRRLHRAGADQLAVAPDLVDDHAEAVVGADVVVEVDVVLEDLVGQRVDVAAGQALLARRAEQRAPDLAADARRCGFRSGVRSRFLDDRRRAATLRRDGSSSRSKRKRAQLAVDRQVERQHRAGLEAGQRVLRAGLRPACDASCAAGMSSSSNSEPSVCPRCTVTSCQLSPAWPRSCASGNAGSASASVVRGGRSAMRWHRARRKSGDDRGDQCAQGREQAGVRPMAPGPAAIEAGGGGGQHLPVQRGFAQVLQAGATAAAALGCIIMGLPSVPV